jgi:hypothetical protein
MPEEFPVVLCTVGGGKSSIDYTVEDCNNCPIYTAIQVEACANYDRWFNSQEDVSYVGRYDP